MFKCVRTLHIPILISQVYEEIYRKIAERDTTSGS